MVGMKLKLIVPVYVPWKRYPWEETTTCCIVIYQETHKSATLMKFKKL